MGGVKGTKYPLKTRNHAPRATRHAPRKTKNSVPPLFFEKAGDKKITSSGAIILLIKSELKLTDITLKPLYKTVLDIKTV